MAHGTPWSPDEMPEYVRLVRDGRPPSDEPVEEMRHNWKPFIKEGLSSAPAAQGAGAALRRTASLNRSPAFIATLESLVRSRL